MTSIDEYKKIKNLYLTFKRNKVLIGGVNGEEEKEKEKGEEIEKTVSRTPLTRLEFQNEISNITHIKPDKLNEQLVEKFNKLIDVLKKFYSFYYVDHVSVDHLKSYEQVNLDLGAMRDYQIGKLQEDLESIRTDFENSSGSVKKFIGDIKNLKDMDSHLNKSLNLLVDRIDEIVKNIDKTINEIKEEIQQNNLLINNISNKYDNLSVDVSLLQQNEKELESAINSLKEKEKDIHGLQEIINITNKTIEDLAMTNEKLKDEIENLNERIIGIEEFKEEMNSNFEKISNKISKLEEFKEGISSDISDLKFRYIDINKQLNEIRKNTQAHYNEHTQLIKGINEKTIPDLKQTMQDHYNRHSGLLENLDNKINDSIANIQKEIDQLKNDIGNSGEIQIEELRNKIKEVERKIVEDLIPSFQEHFDAIADERKLMGQDIDELKKQNEDMNNKINDLIPNVGKLNAVLKDIEEKGEINEPQLAFIQENLNILGENLDRLQNQIGKLVEKIDNMEQTVENLKNRIYDQENLGKEQNKQIEDIKGTLGVFTNPQKINPIQNSSINQVIQENANLKNKIQKLEEKLEKLYQTMVDKGINFEDLEDELQKQRNIILLLARNEVGKYLRGIQY